jgi:hypothetical protein
MHELTRR